MDRRQALKVLELQAAREKLARKVESTFAFIDYRTVYRKRTRKLHAFDWQLKRQAVYNALGMEPWSEHAGIVRELLAAHGVRHIMRNDGTDYFAGLKIR